VAHSERKGDPRLEDCKCGEKVRRWVGATVGTVEKAVLGVLSLDCDFLPKEVTAADVSSGYLR
jgi:hypothetical protein